VKIKYLLNERYLYNSIRFLLSVLVISLPFSKALASVAVVSLLLLSLFKPFINSNYGSFRHSFFTLLPSLLFFSYLISLSYTDNLGKGIDFTYVQNSYFITPLIIWLNRRQIVLYFDRFTIHYIRGVLVACVATLILFMIPEATVRQLITWIPVLNSFPETINRVQFGLYSPFIDRLQFSNLITISIFATLWMCMKRGFRTEFLLTLMVLFTSSVLLGGRGGQLALLGGGIVWIMGFYRMRWRGVLRERMGHTGAIITLIMILGVVGIIFPYTIYKTVPAVSKRYQQLIWELKIYEDGSFRMHDYDHFTGLRRVVAYQNSLKMIREHPVLGVGVGDFQEEMQAIYDRDELKFTVNSHNQVLFMWNTTGILGVLGLLFVVGYGFWRFIKHQNICLSMYATSFLTAYFIIMMFDTINTQIDGMNFSWMYSTLALLISKQR